MTLRRLFARLRRDGSGVAALEFALIAPVFFLLLMGTVEFALILYGTMVLESAVNNSSRLGKTGYTAAGTTRQNTIYNTVKTLGHGLLDPNKLVISTETYKQLSQVGQPEPFTDKNHNGHYDLGETYTDVNGNGHWDADMGVAGLGNAGDIVVYTVTYPWHVSTPVISQIIAQNGIYTLRSSVLVKNEPF